MAITKKKMVTFLGQRGKTTLYCQKKACIERDLLGQVDINNFISFTPTHSFVPDYFTLRADCFEAGQPAGN